MHKIVVYVDRGVSGDAATHTFKSLRMEVDSRFYSIERMDASMIKGQSWEKDTALFIVPGGRDVFYQSALEGEGIQKIKAYVEGGGSYLGICAGAYFASGSIEFEKGRQMEICGIRDLKFFPGLARGAAYGQKDHSYHSEKGAVAARISWKDRSSTYAYFNGGCLFVNPSEFPNIEVLATYDDLEGAPAATIACPFGKGRAVLTGIHFEFSAPLLSSENPYLKQVLPLLEKGELIRRKIFREILEHLGLSLKMEKPCQTQI